MLQSVFYFDKPLTQLLLFNFPKIQLLIKLAFFIAPRNYYLPAVSIICMTYVVHLVATKNGLRYHPID